MRYLVLGFSFVLGLMSSASHGSDQLLNINNNNNPVVAPIQLSDPECYEIASMYDAMLLQYDGKGLVTTFDEQLTLHGGTILQLVKDLRIELPMEQIRSIFHKFGVLQLRPLNGHALLIGCGNCPVEAKYRPADAKVLEKPEVLASPIPLDSEELRYLQAYEGLTPESLRDHRHEGYDTINPELCMNPTIVAAFAINNLKGLLPTTYTKVTYENIFPMRSAEALEIFKHHCLGANVYEFDVNPDDIRINKETPYDSIEAFIAECNKFLTSPSDDKSDPQQFPETGYDAYPSSEDDEEPWSEDGTGGYPSSEAEV